MAGPGTSATGGASLRDQPGYATVSTPLPDVAGLWLRGTEGNAGLVPGQVAAKLEGRRFNNFGEFRSAMWRAAAEVPELAAQFSPSNLGRVRQGFAPIASVPQQYGKQRSYILHHRVPVA